MSTTIETSGLFSEAAYGPEGMPGLNGVTGAGEAHELAWQQAIDSALAGSNECSIIEGLNTELEAGEPQVVIATEGVKQNHPVSWDRLSMTVASMVAWNMQIGMADDETAGVLNAEQVMSADIVVGDLGLTESGSAEDSSGLSHPAVGEGVVAAVSAHGLERALTEAFEPTESLIPVMAVGDKGDLKPEPASVGHENGVTQSTVFDGAVDATLPEQSSGMVAREASTRVSQGEGGESTASANGAPSQLSSSPISSLSDSGMASYVESGALREVDGLGNKAGETVTSAVKPGAGDVSSDADDLSMIQHVRDSSVSENRLNMGQERLQGIRAVLAELDNQVDLKAVMGQERPTVSVDSSRTVTAAEIADSQSLQVDSQDRVAEVASRPGLAIARSPEELKQQAEGQSIKTESPVDGDFEALEDVPQLVRAARKLTPVDKSVKVPASSVSMQTDAGATNTQADINAAVAGNENAEITLDQDKAVESAADDAMTIEASEIPELAIQDPSNIDIDIDDSMGTVRLAMTREAEEVSIRLETPQEVLEEYREMRSEMDERLARQGLDLSQFSADAHGEGADDSVPEPAINKESNQGDSARVVKGAQGLAQDGMNARLVNRIV